MKVARVIFPQGIALAMRGFESITSMTEAEFDLDIDLATRTMRVIAKRVQQPTRYVLLPEGTWFERAQEAPVEAPEPESVAPPVKSSKKKAAAERAS